MTAGLSLIAGKTGARRAPLQLPDSRLSAAGSEQQLVRELDLTRRCRCTVNRPARGTVLRALENHLIRVREVGVIENIERLSAELHIQSLTNSDPLQERRIDIEQARPAQRPASHVPEGPLGGQQKRPRIEEPIGCSQNDRSFKVRIPVRHIGITGVAGTRNIRSGQRREGESACPPDAAIPLPAANQLVYDASGAASEALPVPKRQLIAAVPVERVGEAVGSDAAVQPAIIGTIEVRWLVSGRGS